MFGPGYGMPAEGRRVTFSVSFPTRHTDTFASTGYVHGGVLLALTELAYAAFEDHAGISKAPDIVAVQRSTTADYRAPLPWPEGVAIAVTTTAVADRSFEQRFEVTSAATGRPVATFVHQWAWLDTATGRALTIPADDREKLLANRGD